MVGISKQAFHKHLNRRIKKMEELNYLIPIVDQVRSDHPKMALRYIYKLIGPKTMGRDAFEEQFAQLGYKVCIDRNFRRTTDSTGVIRFDNLIIDREFTHVNQAWVSDITYYEMNGRFYYLTFITDLYSRKVLGWSCSTTLRADQTTIPALRKAFWIRKGIDLRGAIIHSDGGGQYYCKEFLSLTKKQGLVNSMGKTAYENPHAERLNGIIKNNYLKPYNPETPGELRSALTKAVRMYNSEKPHSSIGGMSPDRFEELIKDKIHSNNRMKVNYLDIYRTINTVNLI